ncbi:HTH cro/C1-type domain-containing protein [Cupriavidus necator]|uniref:helix-turn-helix domain-containing protein n=1 Tax=Cupriavidus necator TaxID=106590 RepID=UPI003F73C13C
MQESEFPELKSRLSENIKRFRKAKGFAQERLGLEAGVDRTLVSKIERQIANPTLEILAKLASQLDVTVVDLLSPVRPTKRER